MKSRAFFAISAALVAFRANASLEQDVAACHAVANEHARLACYDALSSAPAATAPAAPTPAAAPEASFGHESIPRPEAKGADRVETHVVGTVDGWRRGTRFTLDNGQVWQSIDDRDSDDRLDRPAVTIKRNFVGHYWMKLGGTSQDVLVTRIQ